VCTAPERRTLRRQRRPESDALPCQRRCRDKARHRCAERPVVLVGHSYGGRSSRRRETIRRLQRSSNIRGICAGQRGVVKQRSSRSAGRRTPCDDLPPQDGFLCSTGEVPRVIRGRPERRGRCVYADRRSRGALRLGGTISGLRGGASQAGTSSRRRSDDPASGPAWRCQSVRVRTVIEVEGSHSIYVSHPAAVLTSSKGQRSMRPSLCGRRIASPRSRSRVRRSFADTLTGRDTAVPDPSARSKRRELRGDRTTVRDGAYAKAKSEEAP